MRKGDRLWRREEVRSEYSYLAPVIEREARGERGGED